VRAERKQTTKNKKYEGDIQRFDQDIEDLMRMVKVPGPQGPQGPKGDDGPTGEALKAFQGHTQALKA
jgi:hypothetical protein